MGDESGYKYILFNNLDLSQELVDILTREFKSDSKQQKIDDVAIEKNRITLIFREHFFAAKVETLINAVHYAVAKLDSHGIAKTAICTECKRPEHELYFLSTMGISFPLCKYCAERVNRDLKEEKRGYMSENKKYILGFLGSLILNLPLVFALSFISARPMVSAFLFIGISIYLGKTGYRIFGAKPGVWMPLIILISSVLTIYGILYLSIAFELRAEGVALEQIVATIESQPLLKKEIFDKFLVASFLSLLFSGYTFYENHQEVKFPMLKKSSLLK